MGIVMIFCGTAYAEEQAVQQDDQQNKVYQTEDGVLSIQVISVGNGKSACN